jgi:hypothetical protein
MPAMKQSATQLPTAQTIPTPQGVPSGLLETDLHMPAWQVASLHGLPSLQATPLPALVQATWDIVGVQAWQAFPGFAVPEA